MKASDFSKALKALAHTLHQLGADQSSVRVDLIASAFSGSTQVSALLATPFDIPDEQTVGSTLGEVADDLVAIEGLVRAVAKPSFVKDWKCLVSILRQNSRMQIRDFVATLEKAFGGASEPFKNPEETLVDAFVRRLSETQHAGDDFRRVVAALEANKAVKQEDMALIATRFAFKTAKSTPRKTSLARIVRRGDSSEAAGAKDRATKGQSAA